MTDEKNTKTTGTTDYEPGSWQATLAESEKRRLVGQKNNKVASAKLWEGAQAAITTWQADNSNDVSAENLAAEAQAALGGKHRKGDASKIKTVALAVRDKSLALAAYPNLSKAYAAAVKMTKTAAAEADEDSAADKAIEALANEAPGSASTPENAAKIVLAKGLDEAARLLLDALGADNGAAHRAFMRALSAEVAGRVTPKTPKKAASGPKAGAKQATKSDTAAPKAAAIDTAKVKAKPKAKPAAKSGDAGATASTKAKPVAVSKSKGDPHKKPLPAKKAAPVKAEKAAPVKAEAPVKKKAAPVVVKR